jgi:hypothetical protein
MMWTWKLITILIHLKIRRVWTTTIRSYLRRSKECFCGYVLRNVFVNEIFYNFFSVLKSYPTYFEGLFVSITPSIPVCHDVRFPGMSVIQHGDILVSKASWRQKDSRSVRIHGKRPIQISARRTSRDRVAAAK